MFGNFDSNMKSNEMYIVDVPSHVVSKEERVPRVMCSSTLHCKSSIMLSLVSYQFTTPVKCQGQIKLTLVLKYRTLYVLHEATR